MPTLIARRFDYEELKAKLRPHDKIVILSCDSCAQKSNNVGGRQGLDSLADKLLADGFNVLRRELIPAACSAEQLKDRLQDEPTRRLFEEADVVIPLCCRMGEKKLIETSPALRILPVTRTLGKGSYSPETGARLTAPAEDVELQIDDPDGIALSDAARQLGLPDGSF